MGENWSPFPTRPLPAVPCLTYDGDRVTWSRWETGLPILCSRVDTACGSCRDPGPAVYSVGTVHPPAGSTWTHERPIDRRPGERRRWTRVQTPAHPYWRLHATCCPACHRIDVIDLAGRAPGGAGARPVEALLCDGCDALCAIGATLTEARATLVTLGGWTGGDADWDLCPACNPDRVPDPPPRAIAARRAATDTTT